MRSPEPIGFTSGMAVSVPLLLLGVATAACGSDRPEAANGTGDAAADGAGDPAAAQAAPRNRAARTSGDVEVLGEIHATLDGDSHTWYVVAGQAKSGYHSSATWFPLDQGERLVAILAYEDEHPPIETFDLDAEGGGMSLGDYEGGALIVTFPVPAGAGSLSVDLSDPAHRGSIDYLPVAMEDDPYYVAEAGSLEVDPVSFEDRKAHLEGRFHGTLRTREGGGSIRIEDGRFGVADIPAQEDLESEP